MSEDELNPELEDVAELDHAGGQASPEEQAERQARARRRLQELDELSPPYRDTSAPLGFKIVAMVLLVGGLLVGGFLIVQSLIRAMDSYNERIERMAET